MNKDRSHIVVIGGVLFAVVALAIIAFASAPAHAGHCWCCAAFCQVRCCN